MEELKGILLGLVQGATEFLPISSSGHTAIFGKYLDFGEGIFSLAISLHVGTLLAIIVFFRRELSRMFLSLFKRGSWLDDPDRRTILLIIVGSIPTFIIGVGIRGFVEDLFTDVQLVAGMLVLNGSILFVAEKYSPSEGRERIEIREALLVGLAQGIALLPGISRSGITIATGMLKGISRKAVASYSFLLSIPAVLGAAAIEFFRGGDLSEDGGIFLTHLLGGMMAFVSGWVSLGLLFWVLRERRLKIFAAYCLLVGIGTLVFG